MACLCSVLFSYLTLRGVCLQIILIQLNLTQVKSTSIVTSTNNLECCGAKIQSVPEKGINMQCNYVVFLFVINLQGLEIKIKLIVV